MEDDLIDIQDLGRQLKIPPKTIRNKLSNGTWPLEPVRIGRALRWRQTVVDRLKRGDPPADSTCSKVTENGVAKDGEMPRPKTDEDLLEIPENLQRGHS